MTILLTGGTGFIGSHLIPKLLNEKYKIVLLKRTISNTWRIKEFIPKLKVYNVDRLNLFDSVFKANKIDIIVHLSGMYVKYHQNIQEVEEMNKVNITIPSKLLDTAVRFNLKGYVNTGSFFEYKPTELTVSENNSVEPFNYYTSTKIAFEQILRFYTKQYKLKSITLKLFTPYGEKDNIKIIPLIMKSFIDKKSLAVTKGEQRLSFTYVEDIIDAYIKSIKYIIKQKKSFYETFNIGQNKTFSIKEIVKMVENISGIKSMVNLGIVPYHQNEIMFMKCRSNKAKRMLGWEPKFSIYDGLKQTYKYYLKNHL